MPPLAGQVFAFAERSHARAALLLALLCAALFWPGFTTLPPMDRDEPRFAQASRQMLESGDLVDIRFQGEARHKKPVGIYWLQAAAVTAGEALGVPQARTTIWLYRLPSLLGAMLAVLFTYAAAVSLTTRRAAMMAAGLMASTILLGVEARLAKTDAMLVATIVIAMAALARVWSRRLAPGWRLEWGWTLAFWLALGAGVLVKGPIGLAVVGLAALTLAATDRDARWLARLRPLIGLPLLIAVVAPWVVAITLKTGGAFFEESVGQDMLGKVAAGQESHGAPPGVYLLAFFGTAWPLAAFVILALPFAWRERSDPAVAFCLAWAVPMWLIFEAVPTKLPHYVLPLYPALAILAGVAAERQALATRGWWAIAAMLLIPIPVLALAVAATAGLWTFDRAIPFVMLPVLAIAMAFAMLALRALRQEYFGTAAVRAVLASLFVAWGIYAAGAPLMRSIAVSPRLAAAAGAAACADPRFATAGFREPSLVFLTRTDLEMTDGKGAAAFLQEGGCRIAFVEKRLETAFIEATIAAGIAPKLLSRVAGVNINGGRRLDIGVYATP